MLSVILYLYFLYYVFTVKHIICVCGGGVCVLQFHETYEIFKWKERKICNQAGVREG